MWELRQDVQTLRGLMHELPMDQPRRHEILRALEGMMDLMDPDDVAGTAAAGREALAGVLARPAYASAHPLRGHRATRTSIRPGCGRCARPSANARGPSPTSWH